MQGREARKREKEEKMVSYFPTDHCDISKTIACSHHSLWLVAPLLSSSSACLLLVWLVNRGE